LSFWFYNSITYIKKKIQTHTHPLYYVFLTHNYHVYKITKRIKKIKTQQYLNIHIDIWKLQKSWGTVLEGFWVTETLVACGSKRRCKHPRKCLDLKTLLLFYPSLPAVTPWPSKTTKSQQTVCFSFSFIDLFFILFFSVLDMLLSTDLFFSFSFPFFFVSGDGKTKGAVGC